MTTYFVQLKLSCRDGVAEADLKKSMMRMLQDEDVGIIEITITPEMRTGFALNVPIDTSYDERPAPRDSARYRVSGDSRKRSW